MESAKVEGTKAKSLFALDSDEETHNEGDSGLAGSLETSPIKNSTDGVTEDVIQRRNSFESRDCREPIEDCFVVEKDALPESTLSAFQKARIERNRQKALLLRQARLQAHPYKK